MKIDNIVFSCSEYYSPFWNIQSQIWKTKFNVEPICLLFGDKNKCNISEKYGIVKEIPFDSRLPNIIQLQFYKFWYPQTDPEKTWLIGDIDQIPLQTEHFLKDLDKVNDTEYVHFNYSLCAQMMGIGLNSDVYIKRGSYVNGGHDLPGHYHCAKGKYYKQLYFGERSFYDVVQGVIDSKRYGMIKEDAQRNLNKEIHGSFWVAEEMYTSEKLWYGLKNKTISGFHGREYHIWDGKIDRVGKYGNQWNGKNYQYDKEALKNKKYVDIHCFRPYEVQEESMLSILKEAEMIE